MYFLFFQLAILLFANLYFNKVYRLSEEIQHLDNTTYRNWTLSDLHDAEFEYPRFHLTVSNWQKIDTTNKPCGEYKFFIRHNSLGLQTRMIKYNQTKLVY